jgi:DNA-binding MarR family transcriptional regulator
MSLTLDPYIIGTLMPDLVGHDKQPSAFVVFLYLWARARHRRAGAHGAGGKWVAASLQQIALESGLSKSAVQQAIRTLLRRRLIHRYQQTATAVPEYLVNAPWRR